MVCECRVHTPELLDQVANGGDVQGDVALELGVGELGERLDLEPLVAVADVHGQQAADVGVVDGHGARRPGLGELRRVAVLADEVNLVAEACERPREVRVVDVRTGAPQQVAVEDQDPHRSHPSGEGQQSKRSVSRPLCGPGPDPFAGHARFSSRRYS
jgi:hypothetical protein